MLVHLLMLFNAVHLLMLLLLLYRAQQRFRQGQTLQLEVGPQAETYNTIGLLIIMTLLLITGMMVVMMLVVRLFALH